MQPNISVQGGRLRRRITPALMALETSVADLDDVYRKYGEVSEAAQLLETELGNILIMIGAVDANLIVQSEPQAAAALFNQINRHTLGQLLKHLHNTTNSAVHLESLLSSALAERNRLAHSFYRQHNFRRNSAEGCVIMLQDLCSIHEALLSAYKSVLLLSGIDLDTLVIDSHPTGHVGI